jgi:AraC family transcriptional regulator of adaptative response / DNA-3-methyladenine glycosylase II
MRAYSYPDAFLEKDSGVAHALPDMTPKERIETVEPCRPWRSYAVISLWNSL